MHHNIIGGGTTQNSILSYTRSMNIFAKRLCEIPYAAEVKAPSPTLPSTTITLHQPNSQPASAAEEPKGLKVLVRFFVFYLFCNPFPPQQQSCKYVCKVEEQKCIRIHTSRHSTLRCSASSSSNSDDPRPDQTRRGRITQQGRDAPPPHPEFWFLNPPPPTGEAPPSQSQTHVVVCRRVECSRSSRDRTEIGGEREWVGGCFHA